MGVCQGGSDLGSVVRKDFPEEMVSVLSAESCRGSNRHSVEMEVQGGQEGSR